MSFSKPPLGPARTDQATKSSRRHALLREDFQKQYWPVTLARAVYEHYEQLQDGPMTETELIVILTVRGIETLPGEWRDVTRKEVVDYLMTPHVVRSSSAYQAPVRSRSCRCGDERPLRPMQERSLQPSVQDYVRLDDITSAPRPSRLSLAPVRSGAFPFPLKA